MLCLWNAHTRDHFRDHSFFCFILQVWGESVSALMARLALRSMQACERSALLDWIPANSLCMHIGRMILYVSIAFDWKDIFSSSNQHMDPVTAALLKPNTSSIESYLNQQTLWSLPVISTQLLHLEQTERHVEGQFCLIRWHQQRRFLQQCLFLPHSFCRTSVFVI